MEGLLGYIGRRWTWLVVGAVLGALAGVGSTTMRTGAWVADSLVVLTDATIPPEEFSAVAAAIFPTDAVLGPVVSELGIEETPGSLISSGALEIGSAPGGLAVRVVARTQDEELTVALANAAAESLATTGEENGFGDMASFAVVGARREKAPYASAGLLGAVVGVALMAAWFALRYLVKGADAPEEARAGAHVTVRVAATPAPDGSTDEKQGVTVTPPSVLEGLWTGFLDGDGAADPITGITIDDGAAGWAILGVAAALDRLASAGEGDRSISWTSATQPLPPDASDRIAVVAPAGAGARLDDVRRTIEAERPEAFVALIVVTAPTLS